MRQASCEVIWLGRRDYREVWVLQKELAAKRLAGEIPDTLLLLEHPPTVTLGRGAEAGNIVASSEWLKRMGFDVVETDRGGDVTYHGPGQLVGYPILNLQALPHRPDLHLYLRNLEEMLILTLAHYGVTGQRFPGYTGAWVGMGGPNPKKVAAIGIKTSRWITQHGFAFNICPDLSHFDVIVPCGIRDYGVTCLSSLLDRPITVQEALPVVQAAFEKVFELDCVNVPYRHHLDGVNPIHTAPTYGDSEPDTTS